MPTRLAIHRVVVALALATTAACSSTPPQQPLTLETANGYTYVRNNGTTNSDNALYPGLLSVGPDSCLYVAIDKYPGRQYLVVLGSESYIWGNGVSTRGSGRVLLDSRANFGREGYPNWKNYEAEFLARCSHAEELWGIM